MPSGFIEVFETQNKKAAQAFAGAA